jgi:NTP pyrophosphatase (non-canonical NTP hydrolase)
MKIVNAGTLNQFNGAILLQEYERLIIETDRFSVEDINPIRLGLYGEVGSIMAASKKFRREKKAYPTYKDAVEEEFGDALWYFSALCKRVNIELAGVFDAAFHEIGFKLLSANEQENSQKAQFIASTQVESLDSALIELGSMAAQLLKTKTDSVNIRDELVQFARLYLKAMQSIGLSFAKIIKSNLIKTQGRFTVPDKDSLPDFDAKFPEEEQLPRYFEIHITQLKSGQSFLRWNGVFIGSPLTDNIRNPDGYRFHDVFHLSHAAILHWSPTFRRLIKQKRKSNPDFDEAQDSGRAIVVVAPLRVV